MKQFLARATVALALVGFAVPAIACEAMKKTTTTAESTKDKDGKKTEAKKEAAKTSSSTDKSAQKS
jgi:hypothetical protein